MRENKIRNKDIVNIYMYQLDCILINMPWLLVCIQTFTMSAYSQIHLFSHSVINTYYELL